MSNLTPEELAAIAQETLIFKLNESRRLLEKTQGEALRLTYAFTEWACDHAVDRNDILWDHIEDLRRATK
jgi:hypothetical protein